MIHRFPRLWAGFFDRSDQPAGEWAAALRENGADGGWFDEAASIDAWTLARLFG